MFNILIACRMIPCGQYETRGLQYKKLLDKKGTCQIQRFSLK